ncbi:hypothetical protein TWF481_005917 [Arthrobotrys musiformis]|uniref:Uncharacterized protein n=1 Tax=Arthrobotrys musiformis TaxID=47236 RepID=A0AAV9WGD0_9PEZI
MATPRSVRKHHISTNKENLSRVPSPLFGKSDDGEDEEGEFDVSRRKFEMRVGEYGRRERMGVLSDVTGEFVNARQGRVRGGKADFRDDEWGGSEEEGLEEVAEAEDGEEGVYYTDEEISRVDIPDRVDLEQPPDSSNTSLSISEDSSTGLNVDDTELNQPPRTDNCALRALLHPASYTDLRSTHLADISLSQQWRLKKQNLITSHPDSILQSPQTPQTPKYRRPKNRKIPSPFAKPASNLWRHLGLYNNPESKTAQKLLTWLRKEDQLLLSQISLVAPRMEFQHIQEVHTHAFQPLRVKLLEYLRKYYDTCTWCLFFCEFVYVNSRHEVAAGETTVNGSCLFLMISSEETAEIKKVAEGMLRKLQFGRELAVFVRQGNPRLYGSYGLMGKQSYEEEREETTTPGVRIGFPSFFQRSSPKTPDTKKVNKKNTPSPRSAASSRLTSWSPSPTPPARSPVQNIKSIHWDKPIYWRDLDAFTYGLRWVTKLAIPSAEEGENAKFQEYPDLGASLGARGDYGSGTLAGYLTDRNGVVYAMSCHHVLYFLDESNIWPLPSNAIVDSSSTQPISPAMTDLRHQTRATAHEVDGLMHEAVCAYTRGNTALAERTTAAGRKKLREHDRLIEGVEDGGVGFGSIVASAWKIAHINGAPWIMDQVVLKPEQSRVGTNTFTYTNRDNKSSRRHRLEARGWTSLPLNSTVLKIGRTTSLTKGTVISLNADVRVLVGEDQQPSSPTSQNLHRVQRFWEVQSGIITGATGPWFSEPGDSGAWILKFPGFEEMLHWDLRRSGGKGTSDPIAAPVGGMLFGGADSVDGINLTFYNPTHIIRKYLVSMLGPVGKDLTPGFGSTIPPEALCQEWEDQEKWARQNEVTTHAWEGFVNSSFWGYQMQRYSNNHLFRGRRWWEEWERKVRAVTKAGIYSDRGVEERGEGKSKLHLRFEQLTPRGRKGTTEGRPDTPSTVSRVRNVTPPYVPAERMVREVITSGRKVGSARKQKFGRGDESDDELARAVME